MTTHSKGKVFEEDPDFDKALEEFRTAWKNGKAASDEATETAKKKLLSHGYTKKAAQAILALKTMQAGAGSDLAGEQKRKLLLAAAPTIAYAAEKLKEEFTLLVKVGAVPKKAWKKRLPPLDAEYESLKPFDGYFGKETFPDSIITEACELGELAKAFSKPPSPGFSTGIRAKSRIAGLLKAAEGKKHTESWAREYLVSTVTCIAAQDKKAIAITNILVASVSLEAGTEFRQAFVKALSGNFVTPGGEPTFVGRKVFSNLRMLEREKGPLAKLRSEFRAALLGEEPKGQPEKTSADAKTNEADEAEQSGKASKEPITAAEGLLSNPASWARRLEEGEELRISKRDISYFESQPAHRLLNAAIVIANADVHPKLNLVRGTIATKLMLPIGSDLLVHPQDGKKLILVEQNQEKLFSKIRGVMELPQIKEEVEEYCSSSADGEEKDRLISMYVEKELHAMEPEPLDEAPLPEEDEVTPEFEVLSGNDSETADLKQPEAAEEADAAEEEHPEAGPAEPAEEPVRVPEEQEAMEAEEPLLDAPPVFSETNGVALIFKKQEEAIPLLEEIASDVAPLPDRTYAVGELANLLETPGKSPQPLIQELSKLAYSEEGSYAIAAMLSLPHVSKYDWASRRNSSHLVSVLAAAVQFSSKNSISPELENKLLHGSEEEADYAIDVLAQKARIYGRKNFAFPESTPLQEIALAEAERTAEPARFARLALAFKGLGAQPESLNHYINLAMEEDPASVQKTLLAVLNAHRAQNPGSVFTPTTDEDYIDLEAEAAEDFFFWLGKGEESLREISLAAAVSEIYTPESAQFMVQRLSDATDEDEVATWNILLKEFKGTEADAALRQAFHLLPGPKKEGAIALLSERPPSMDNAEFFLSLCISEDETIASLSANALLRMGFSSLDTEREFNLLYRMRNHPNPGLVQAAEGKLRSLLEEREKGLPTTSVEKLSSLYLDDPNLHIRELARKSLLQKCSSLFAGDNPLDLISAKQPDSLLATYALAAEMQLDSLHLDKSVSQALRKFSDNPIATLHLMVAAAASQSEKYAQIVIVPNLGADEIISESASSFLLHMGEDGLRVAARAASRENLPEGISSEEAKRISDKAIETLCKAEAFQELVPLLSSPRMKVRSNIYEFLESSIKTSEKPGSLVGTLLDAASSGHKEVRLSALNLIPQEEKYLEHFIKFANDPDEDVSALSARLAASLFSPLEVVQFLNSNGPVLAKQRIADAYLKHSPKAVAEIASLAEAENFGLQAVSALGFFQVPEALTFLFDFQEKLDGENKDVLAEALQYFCRTLAELKNPKESDMLSLLIAHYAFDYDGVHQEILSALSPEKADYMQTAAIKSKEPMLLFSATKLFLSAGLEHHAFSTAKELRKIGGGIPTDELTEPYQQVLFGGEADKMGSIESPFEDNSADPLPYRLVKNIAIDQMANGNGAPGSFSLFLFFLDKFGEKDREGIFDPGIKAVSEVIWLNRAGTEEHRKNLAGKLPNLVAKGILDDSKVLSEILLLQEYGRLDALKRSPGQGGILGRVVEHALRGFVEESLLLQHSPEPQATSPNLRLLAELQSRGLVLEEQISSLADEGNPIALAIAGRPLSREEFEKGENLLELAFSALEKEANMPTYAINAIREKKEACRKTEDLEMREMARIDAAKLERRAVRAAPPAREKGRPVEPKRPTRSPSSAPPKK